MTTEEKLRDEQKEIFFAIQKAGFNITTCGNCGTILLSRLNLYEHEPFECFNCREEIEPCNCPDLWY